MLISQACMTAERHLILYNYVDFTSREKLRDVDFTLKKYTYMLISHQKATSKVLFSLKKQL